MVRKARQGTFRFDPHLAKGARWVLAQIWARNIMLTIAVAMVVAGAAAPPLGRSLICSWLLRGRSGRG